MKLRKLFALALILCLALTMFTACGSDEGSQGDGDTGVKVETDEKGFYSYGGNIVKADYPMDEDSLANAAEKMERIYDLFFKDTDAKVYFSIVPDKNYFIGEAAGQDTMDYSALISAMTEATKGFTQYIDITGKLAIEDYYLSDAHWRQEDLGDVAQTIGDAMGVELPGLAEVSGTPLEGSDDHVQKYAGYETIVAFEEFIGAYVRQSELEMQTETLKYLQSDLLDGCKVTNFETNSQIPVYDLEIAQNTEGKGYDMFLGGSKSLITVENPAAKEERELVMFRDSFGSSLAPLFVEGYSKITLVDTRYIVPDMLENFVDLTTADEVLFLYSTPLLNSSVTMK